MFVPSGYNETKLAPATKLATEFYPNCYSD